MDIRSLKIRPKSVGKILCVPQEMEPYKGKDVLRSINLGDALILIVKLFYLLYLPENRRNYSRTLGMLDTYLIWLITCYQPIETSIKKQSSLSPDISPRLIKIGFKALIHMSLRQIDKNYKLYFSVFRRR
jgi:hypothetical protein